MYIWCNCHEINEICGKHDRLVTLRLNSSIIAKIRRNTASFQNCIMKIKIVFSRLTILINGTAYLLLNANLSNGLKDVM